MVAGRICDMKKTAIIIDLCIVSNANPDLTVILCRSCYYPLKTSNIDIDSSVCKYFTFFKIAYTARRSTKLNLNIACAV